MATKVPGEGSVNLHVISMVPREGARLFGVINREEQRYLAAVVITLLCTYQRRYRTATPQLVKL